MAKCFKAKIRLYRKLDKDLIALYRHPSFSLSDAMRKALTMATRSEGGYIELPSVKRITDVPKKIEFTIDIYEDDVKEFFKSIPRGFRNDTIKNLVRGYLTGPVISAFLEKDGYDNLDYFNSAKKDIIQARRRKSESTSLEVNEFKEIQKILTANGQSATEMLKILQEQNMQKQKESVAIVEEEEIPLQKKEEKVEIKESTTSDTKVNVVGTKAKDYSNVEKTKEEIVENSDFDVFSAIDNMFN